MLQQDLLLTLAEVSVTIAALSAVAGVVRNETLSVVSFGLLRDVAVIGMLVALFAFIPLIFWNEDTVIAFRLSAVGAATTWLVGYAVYLGGVFKDKSQITKTFWVGMAITLLGLFELVLCALSEERAAITFYLIAMIAWLAIAGLNFLASVFSGAAPVKE